MHGIFCFVLAGFAFYLCVLCHMPKISLYNDIFENHFSSCKMENIKR